MNISMRLREAMSIRNLGALDLFEKIYALRNKPKSFKDPQEISMIADGRCGSNTEETRKKKYVILTREKLYTLAEALDIEVSQLIGTKEITDDNIRPFRSKNERDIGFAAFNGASGTKDNEIEEYLRALNNYKEKQ